VKLLENSVVGVVAQVVGNLVVAIAVVLWNSVVIVLVAKAAV